MAQFRRGGVHEDLMVITGKITGGHIFPGIAVAEELRARKRLAQSSGWAKPRGHGGAHGCRRAATTPPGSALPRARQNVAWPALCASCCCRSPALRFWRALRDPPPSPTWCSGMGGYITFPGGMMAVLAVRSCCTSRIRSPATPPGAGAAWPTARFSQPRAGKAPWAGNPVRAEIAAVLPPPAERTLGARAESARAGGRRQPRRQQRCSTRVVPDAAPSAEQVRPVIVASGWRDAKRLVRNATRAAGAITSCALHRRHGGGLRRADLVICRRGLTVAELARRVA